MYEWRATSISLSLITLLLRTGSKAYLTESSQCLLEGKGKSNRPNSTYTKVVAGSLESPAVGTHKQNEVKSNFKNI